LYKSIVILQLFLMLVAAPLPGQTNPHVAQSAWPMPHRNSARQASTPGAGPVEGAIAEVRYFVQDAGKDLQASPFMVISGKRYPNRPTARVVWAASLNHVYKYVADDKQLIYADSLETSKRASQLSWNILALAADDRILVPMPSGLNTAGATKLGCTSKHPALAAFTDGDTPESAIQCVSLFEYTPQRMRAACGFPEPLPFIAGNLTGVLFNGDIATVMERNINGLGPLRALGTQEGRESYLLVVANDLSRVKACTKIADSSPTNQFPIERLPDGRDAIYIATANGLVLMHYDAARNSLTKAGEVQLPFRTRTGTTPTLIGFGDDRDKFVFVIDAQCAVARVTTGAITCDGARDRPSQLIAVRRDNFTRNSLKTIDLPPSIDTVENSPAAYGYDIVVTNYSGYTPDGPKDGKRNFAKGVVKLSWNPTKQAFQTDWTNLDIQMNGVPTISAASNLVYSSGGESDGNSWFYGVRMKSDTTGPGGAVVVRIKLGRSKPSARGAADWIFDQGNNTLLLDDGSAIFSGGPSIVRVTSGVQ
jgi:hypothetical protein